MDKKQHLLDTALKLFVEFGFHGTPTAKIAKEAGLSSGTLFYFFSTKDELVTSLYVDIKGKMTAAIMADIEGETSIKRLIEGYFKTPLFWALNNPIEFSFTVQFSNSPYLNQLAAKEIDSHIKPFLTILKRGVKEGVLKKIDPELIFALVRGHTFSIHQYLIEHPASLKKQSQIIETAFSIIWDMIAV
ncbi:TetR/AcrR family transcriptional regulator [Pedobacter zeae]|uniref:AcrR family transcriptional regulator n=1 Tax=Pedobacter zeae TaxID=1737356 RepID=A0A7W6KC62_9SPHI|nr:TetR/AcrR family transcriptional regulator [Pedobacter zeae]MBB4109078.1 AcrR family transcriptional regulator [Pedobacter zeae]GGH10138.1 TetR family transcriptional regulator [Pedobacter zeae]